MELQRELNIELVKYRSAKELISKYMLYFLRQVSDEINLIGSLSFDESVMSFDRIFKIQNILSTAKYRFEYPVKDDVAEFIFLFERDDEFSRKYWFEKIKNGYKLPGCP